MEFIYPSFLWALLALAIPIIIHLFYFRRHKKVYFTNVKLLQELKEETSTSNRLKDLLILLCRCLAIASLVFAFAQPFLTQGREVKTGNTAVSIFLDNSFSMDAEKNEVPLLEIAKAKARQIVSAYTDQDRFQLITHDFEGRHQRLVSKENALSFIDEVAITPQSRSMDQIVYRQKQAIDRAEEHEAIYVLSDFQSSMLSDDIETDTITEMNFLPIQPIINNNVAIDSVWLPSLVPIINQNNPIVVRMTNYGSSDAEGIRLTSNYDNQEKPEGTFDIPAGKTITDTVNINIMKPGPQNITLKVSDYPIQYDDTYYVSMHVPTSIQVLSIYDNSQNSYLNALFKGLNFYELTNQRMDAVDYGKLAQYDLIILNDLRQISSGLSLQLDKYVTGGGNLLIFPERNIDIASYNTLFSALGVDRFSEKKSTPHEVKYINTDDFVFQDVYRYVSRNISLPSVQEYYSMTHFQNRGKQDLMKFRDGSPYLTKYHKNGQVYICASSLSTDVNDIAKKAEVFVPMIYKMSLASSEGQKIAYTIGQDRLIEVKKPESSDIVYKISGREEFIPGQKTLEEKMLLDVQDQITEAGYYTIQLDEKAVGTVAYNYYRKESNLSFPNENEMSDYAISHGAELLSSDVKEDFSNYIAEKERGVPLWKWFLISALIFLALEILIIKLFKNR